MDFLLSLFFILPAVIPPKPWKLSWHHVPSLPNASACNQLGAFCYLRHGALAKQPMLASNGSLPLSVSSNVGLIGRAFILGSCVILNNNKKDTFFCQNGDGFSFRKQHGHHNPLAVCHLSQYNPLTLWSNCSSSIFLAITLVFIFCLQPCYTLITYLQFSILSPFKTLGCVLLRSHEWLLKILPCDLLFVIMHFQI